MSEYETLEENQLLGNYVIFRVQCFFHQKLKFCHKVLTRWWDLCTVDTFLVKGKHSANSK